MRCCPFVPLMRLWSRSARLHACMRTCTHVCTCMCTFVRAVLHTYAWACTCSCNQVRKHTTMRPDLLAHIAGVATIYGWPHCMGGHIAQRARTSLSSMFVSTHAFRASRTCITACECMCARRNAHNTTPLRIAPCRAKTNTTTVHTQLRTACGSGPRCARILPQQCTIMSHSDAAP